METTQPSYPGGGAGAGGPFRKPPRRRPSTPYARLSHINTKPEEPHDDIDATVNAYSEAMHTFEASIEEYFKAKRTFELGSSGDAGPRISEQNNVLQEADLVLDKIENMLKGKPFSRMEANLSEQTIRQYNTGVFTFAEAAIRCGATVPELKRACHQYSIFVWKGCGNWDVRIGGSQHKKKLVVNDAGDFKILGVRLNYPWEAVKLQVATAFGKSVETFKLSFRREPRVIAWVESDTDWTNCLAQFYNCEVQLDMSPKRVC